MADFGRIWLPLSGEPSRQAGMDDDLTDLSRDDLVAEVIRLRNGIRAHRDSSGHELCWHHPQLWELLPEPIPDDIRVPAWPQFLRGCLRYRESLDQELPHAPRIAAEFDQGRDTSRS
jgi:hypothetical protein